MSQNPFKDAEARAISHDDPDDLQFLLHHAPLPDTAISRVVDPAIRWFGSAISWFWIALMLVIVINVAMKNFFGDGRIEFEEIQWHIYSALFMLGLSYTLTVDDHVRVDILYGSFSTRTKAWVDFFGIILFLLPFCGILIYYGIPFIVDSYNTAERSSAPAGLANRWMIKAMLVVGIALLAIAALSRMSRIIALLFLGRTALPPSPTKA